ncbi:MAG: hypothetical protein ACRDSZ_02790 [Pseudonocardiaceae bacterium]
MAVLGAGSGECSGEEANIAEDDPTRGLRTGRLHSLPFGEVPVVDAGRRLRRQVALKWVPAARSSVGGWPVAPDLACGVVAPTRVVAVWCRAFPRRGCR